MSTLSDAQRPPGSAVEPLRAKCGWIVALGIVYVIAGLIALSSVAIATVKRPSLNRRQFAPPFVLRKTFGVPKETCAGCKPP